MILTGVESEGSFHRGLVEGLIEAGVAGAIEVNEWGYHPFGTFRNLRALEKNRTRAQRLAEELLAYRDEHPSAPITLIGYSGGGAIALWAAEALPEERVLEQIILSGVAISPTYDVSLAMARCRRGIVNFYSERDWFMAGKATEIFGTMDRVKTSTAGRYGFQDEDGRLLECPGLVQVAWVSEWRTLGHRGGHSGWRARRWGRDVLASYIQRSSVAEAPRPGPDGGDG